MSPAKRGQPSRYQELIERLLALKDGEWLPIEAENPEFKRIRQAAYHGLAMRGYRLETYKDAKNKRTHYFRAGKISSRPTPVTADANAPASGAKEEPAKAEEAKPQQAA
ncbi:MAG: hypothetical protein WBC04_11030 [Candidatus Acidiferrales bacterium]